VVSISPIISADKDRMREHLEFLFGRALSGKVEITAIHTDKEAGHKPRTRFFAVDELDEAAEHAARVNKEQGWNAYVGAALRNDDVFPGQAADDGDFWRAYAVWADADDGEHLDHARDKYRELGLTPPMIVVTGRTPSKRAQMWWPLDNPIEDIDALRGLLRGIAGVLGTDPKVCTGKQLMRLGGSVSWPKKEDRILERTEVVRVDRAAREFSFEQLARAFPPQERASGGSVTIDVQIEHGGALGLEERIMDGREGYAFRLIRAHLREYIGTTGSEPDADELYRIVAPIYLAKTDQVRPGRGPAFLKEKVSEALRTYHAGQIPGMRDLEEAVLTWAQRHDSDPLDDEDGRQDESAETTMPASGPFRASAFSGDAPERQWVVKDWIVQGAVNSLYGDGGLGKTLLAQQLACSVSLGVPWLGLPVSKGSVLAVLCEDDKNELHRRHNAIKAAMGYVVGNPFDDVWLWPRVGEDNTLVRWDRDAKATLSDFAKTLADQVRFLQPSLLILDTLADFYGGNEIDRVQVNYFVKTVLGGLIKEREDSDAPLTVLLLGHPSVAGKASGSGYSGSTAWNAAVRSRIYLARPEEGSSDERILTRGKANYAASGDETALRLFFANGALHAESDTDDTDSVHQGALREVERMVASAWRANRPYTAAKGSARYIYTALAADLDRAGFSTSTVRQVIRQSLEDGNIYLSRDKSRRGYRCDAGG